MKRMNHQHSVTRKNIGSRAQDWVHGLSNDFDLRLPRSLRWLSALGLVAMALAIVLWFIFKSQVLSLAVLGVGLLHASPAILGAALIWGLRIPRMRIRDQMVRSVSWQGDEQVLDVGTGSGILLIGCAEQLVNGKVTGIDVWNPNAGGGTEEIFWKNVRKAGIEERAKLHNADVRQLPFENESFDVITSSFAAHHFGNEADREKAAREIVRVLKPDGQIVFYDVPKALNELEQVMQQAGFTELRRNGRLFHLLVGRKPPG